MQSTTKITNTHDIIHNTTRMYGVQYLIWIGTSRRVKYKKRLRLFPALPFSLPQSGTSTHPSSLIPFSLRSMQQQQQPRRFRIALNSNVKTFRLPAGTNEFRLVRMHALCKFKLTTIALYFTKPTSTTAGFNQSSFDVMYLYKYKNWNQNKNF